MQTDSCVFIACQHRLRGGQSVCPAFFPLAIVGQWENEGRSEFDNRRLFADHMLDLY
jgi:hypothetical protein